MVNSKPGSSGDMDEYPESTGDIMDETSDGELNAVDPAKFGLCRESGVGAPVDTSVVPTLPLLPPMLPGPPVEPAVMALDVVEVEGVASRRL